METHEKELNIDIKNLDVKVESEGRRVVLIGLLTIQSE